MTKLIGAFFNNANTPETACMEYHFTLFYWREIWAQLKLLFASHERYL